MGKGVGAAALSAEIPSGGIVGSVRLARAGTRRALGGLALRLAVVSHSPFQFRCAPAPNPLAADTYRIFPRRAQAASAENW